MKRIFDTDSCVRMQQMQFQGGVNTGALHAIGNGEMMLYGRGPEWLQALGAPYSSPTSMEIRVPASDSMYCETHRIQGTNTYQHTLAQGVLTDCASRKHNCLARHWSLSAPVRFEIDFCGFKFYDVSTQFASPSYLVYIPQDAFAWSNYVVREESFMRMSVMGDYSLENTQRGLIITMYGEGTLVYTGSRSCIEGAQILKNLQATAFEEILASSQAEDRAYLSACKANRAPLRQHPLKAEVENSIEDVLLQIHAQQHSSGGVQAGHNYHLAYIRDQYGVSRGLMAMGDIDGAKRILEFYLSVFTQEGRLCNAQGMGVKGLFHIHENDDSEITGYLLLQATDLLEKTGDTPFFLQLKPLLTWAMQQQIGALHRGMLPFNGDETYIAGGLLPRRCINHGSFEATLLFITGGQRVLKAFKQLHAWEAWMDEAEALIAQTQSSFDENFLRENEYTTNSLKRLEGLTEPEFRHGVCYSGDFFGWLHREAEGCYPCPKCAGKITPQPLRQEYHLKSALLMPSFIASALISQSLLIGQTNEFLTEFRKTGRLPSLPNGDRCTGYDCGLMLFAAKNAGIAADDVLEKLLSMKDECGMWSEYYCGDTHEGTRCRPWESAINIAGAISYLST